MPRVVPIIIPFKQKKQQLPAKKIAEARPFKKMWPKILAYMVAHPELKTRKLWAKFAPKLDDVFSLRQFSILLGNNGMSPAVVKEETGMKNQVAIAIQSFAEVKKEKANVFMNRISRKMDEIHDVIDSTPVDVKNVGGVLDLVSRLHKEGRIAYSIDEEHTVDRKATNIAVLIGYDPKPKEIKVIS